MENIEIIKLMNVFADSLADAIAKKISDRIKIDQEHQEDKKEERFLSPKEVCKKYQVSLSTLWRWSRAGVLCPKKVGAKSLYRESEVINYFK